MKIGKESFSQYLSEEEIANPYTFLDEFYKTYDLSEVKVFVSSWIKAVNENKMWKKGCPSDLLFFHDMLVRLLETATLMVQMENGADKVIVDQQANNYLGMVKKELAGKFGYDENFWSFYPGGITPKEFINPYRALPKVFKFRTLIEWKEILHRMLHHALSSADLMRVKEEVDLLGYKKMLYKLVNANYLIHSRRVRNDTLMQLKQEDEL